MSDWLMTFFSGAGVTFLIGIMWLIAQTIRHQEKIGHCDDKLESIKDRLCRLEAYYDAQTNKKIKMAQSPLALTPYALALLEEIDFFHSFDKIKDELAHELDKHQLRTRYDVQDMADFIVRKKKQDPLFDELKGKVFKKGKNWDEVIAATSIPLRDYYFSVHPEIKE